MYKSALYFLTAALLAFIAIGCNKDNGSSEEDKNWEDWMGVKVLMEDAGFDTKGIKILLGDTPGNSMYLSDLAMEPVIWVGEKNGSPWVGIGLNHPTDSRSDRFFRDFVFTDRNAPKTVTRENEYKQSLTLEYKRISPFFFLADEQYTYIGVTDIYSDGDKEYKETSTLYIHDGQRFCGRITDIDINKKAGSNIGWQHDLLAYNACFSTDGKKQYDITNTACQRLYAMEKSGWYQTYALSREDFLTLGFYNQIPCVEVAIVNLKTAENAFTTRLGFGEVRPEKATSFKLESVKGDVFVYKLVALLSDNSTKSYTITVDIANKTADMK